MSLRLETGRVLACLLWLAGLSCGVNWLMTGVLAADGKPENGAAAVRKEFPADPAADKAVIADGNAAAEDDEEQATHDVTEQAHGSAFGAAWGAHDLDADEQYNLHGKLCHRAARRQK